ncbi:MAG: DUF3846 domain-containing protein [Clostridia bacterium]|nr:DUF3846 domain-containing protein [Clostridia bacterium]
MNVLVVEPYKKPYEKDIEPGLESLQEAVGGNIEAIYPFDEPVAVICNDEGKLLGLPLNRAIRDESGAVRDIIAGTFIVTGLGEEDFCELSPELTELFKERYATPEQFITLGGSIIVQPYEVPDIPAPPTSDLER